MVPSPKELSKEFLDGKLPKPIKITYIKNKIYLVEGRLKYWAWVIAFGNKKKNTMYFRIIYFKH